jgi:endonuclease/exonuclease/phosphatase family metal-dependent hydrolase
MKISRCLYVFCIFCVVSSPCLSADIPIHAMTFNLYNRPVSPSKRLQQAHNILATTMPDIVALQEVAQWCQGDNPIQKLADSMGYHSTGFWLEKGWIRNSGLGILSRFPIHGSKLHAFQKNLFWDQKGFLYATINHPQSPFGIVNVHMSSKEGGPVKEAQFQELQTFLQTYRTLHPVLVMGDFNEPVTTPLFKTWIQNLQASDIIPIISSHTPNPRTWASAYGRPCTHPKAEQLDTLLLIPSTNPQTPSLSWAKGSIVEPHTKPLPSDHCPVSGTFSIHTSSK